MPSVSMVREDFNNRLSGEKIRPEDKPSKKFRDVWAEFTHVGRKTFVVTGLSSGLSPYTITQWTGHSSLKAMKPYMALADKVKKESMKKFDEV